MGRPKGSKNTLQRSWVYDQLIAKKFDVLDEAILLYRDTDQPHQKIEILRILTEFALPKPRPVDASGDPESAATITFLTVTDEQALQIAKAAREEHENDTKGES